MSDLLKQPKTPVTLVKKHIIKCTFLLHKLCEHDRIMIRLNVKEIQAYK